jgi:diaminopropionate ammonia-lyase
MTRVLYRDRDPLATGAEPPVAPRELHAAFAGYAPTPLLSQPQLARALGVAHVDVKLETDRLDLPSFKIMGASWATVRALAQWLPAGWEPRHGLEALAGKLPELTLVAATDGNHGRALSRVARILGLRSLILVPESLSATRVSSIAAEGAQVVRVVGSYDDAIEQSAREAESEGHVLVSDTSWDGYELIPQAVIDGYATILWEVEEQLTALGRKLPDLVLVQLGVGAFGAAVIRHLVRPEQGSPRIVGVEPTRAACVMASLAAGRRVLVPGPHDSVMVGLNCGIPSLVAWPLLRQGLDATIALDDESALDGVRTLAAEGLAVGECSGVVVSAARELLAGPYAAVHRARLGLADDASVLLFATEGVTDADSYAQALEGSRPAAVEGAPRP